MQKSLGLSNANTTLLHRNWAIGTFINENNKWGSGFLDNLSRDIKSEFPDVTGFSVRNLRDMKNLLRYLMRMILKNMV